MSPLALGLVALMLLAAAVGLLLWLAASGAQARRAQRMLARAGQQKVMDQGGLSDLRDDGGDPLTRWVTHRLWRSGIRTQSERVTLALVGAALLVLVLLLLAGPALGGLLSIILAGVAYLVLARKASARRRALLEQLPDYLDHVLRALSAGNTLEESIGEAAREAPEPSRTLFTQIARQSRLGAPVAEVLARQGEIHDLRDLNALAMAAAVNKQYGGSLRRIIRSLIAAVRARDAAGRELRALTAESRFSAGVLVLISLGLTAYILMQNPQYYAEMWASPDTRALLMGSAGLQLAGIVVIYRMVQSTEGLDS